MRLKVVDRHQRLVVDQRDCLGGGETHDHAADQAGPGSRGDAVDVSKSLAGLHQGLADDTVERLDMGARGDLRHHAAERGMFGDLRQHDIGQDFAQPVAGALDDRGGGLVACGLDSEYKHGVLLPRSHDNREAP